MQNPPYFLLTDYMRKGTLHNVILEKRNHPSRHVLGFYSHDAEGRRVINCKALEFAEGLASGIEAVHRKRVRLLILTGLHKHVNVLSDCLSVCKVDVPDTT